MAHVKILFGIFILVSGMISGCIAGEDSKNTIFVDDDNDCVSNSAEEEMGMDPQSNDSDNDSYLDSYDRFPTDPSKYKLDEEEFIREDCYNNPDFETEKETTESSNNSNSESQQAGSDTQTEISGKVSVVTAWIANNQSTNSSVMLTWELAPGSEETWEDQIFWTVICDNNGTTGVVVDNFIGGRDLRNQNEKPLPDLSKLSEPGGIYTLELQISNGSDTSCPLIVNEEMTLMISINGGGSTYETLSIVSTAIGSTIL